VDVFAFLSTLFERSHPRQICIRRQGRYYCPRLPDDVNRYRRWWPHSFFFSSYRETMTDIHKEPRRHTKERHVVIVQIERELKEWILILKRIHQMCDHDEKPKNKFVTIFFFLVFHLLCLYGSQTRVFLPLYLAGIKCDDAVVRHRDSASQERRNE